MFEKREAVFNGGPFQSYWWADEHDPVHLSIRARLDSPVDPEALDSAWERTKRVYPLIDLAPDDEDEEVLFYPAQGISLPLESREPVRPAGEAALGRGFAVTWFADTVTLTCYHSLADERGLTQVFRTLLACYFAQAEKSAPCPAGLPREGRRPEEYFVQNTMLPSVDFEPVPVLLFRDIREIYNDESIAPEEGSCGSAGQVSFPFAPWQALCEKNGVSSECLLLGVAAGMIRDASPGDGRKLCLSVMTDFRETWSLPEDIAPCSKKMPVILSREEMGDLGAVDLALAAARIREKQLTPAYIRSHVAMENTYGVLNIRNACFNLQYSGELDLGENTRRVLDVSMRDASLRTVFMIRLGDEMKVSFQYGGATGAYMRMFAGALEKLGIPARISAQPQLIHPETDGPTE